MHCNFLNIYHRRLKLGRIVPHSQCKSLVRFQPFLTFSQPSAVPGVLASGMALLQMAGNHCNRLAHSVGLLGSLPQPKMPKFCQNTPCNENYENKGNKMGLLLNPLVIGTISVEPPCRPSRHGRRCL